MLYSLKNWLNCYLRPAEVILDRGTEFQVELRDLLVKEMGITQRLITTRNPQANSMVEQYHQTIQSMIATTNITSRASLPDGRWDGILGAVAFTPSPCELLYIQPYTHATCLRMQRDPSHTVRSRWQYIRERRQKVIMQNNDRENAKQVPHVYNVNDEVIIKNPQQHCKIGAP
jgi:transposase InsO family protein